MHEIVASTTPRPCSVTTPQSWSSRPPWRGKYVNGVDIIRCNDAGRIIEFRVMIRPLQADHLTHLNVLDADGRLWGAPTVAADASAWSFVSQTEIEISNWCR